MERTVNIPAHLLLDAETIRLGRERAEVAKALRSSPHDAQAVVENAHEKLDEALMVHWDAVIRAKEGERLVRIQINAAEAAAHGQQVREDATLIVAQRLVPQ